MAVRAVSKYKCYCINLVLLILLYLMDAKIMNNLKDFLFVIMWNYGFLLLYVNFNGRLELNIGLP